MNNLHKTPEMLALEAQWRKQSGGNPEPPPAAATAGPAAAPQGALLSLGSVDDLKVPSLPAAAVLLIEMCHDVNVNYRKLAAVIQSDPGLSVRILRIANSAYYAQKQNVSSVVRALTVLGLNEVRSIGLSYKLMNVIKDFAHDNFDFNDYWEKSLLMAVMAKEFARQMKCPLHDQAFLVGLLQDIGIVILRYNKEAEYRQVADIAAASAKTPLVKIEQQLFGTNHARIGAEVCEAWKFPKLLTEAIRRHHVPPTAIRAGDPASELQAVAYAAAQMPDFLIGDHPMKIIDDLESRKILVGDDLGSLFARAHASFEALFSLFDCHNTHDAQVARLMLEASDRVKKLSAAQLQVCEPPQ